jgi:pilus assembly protein Flp/PilA
VPKPDVAVRHGRSRCAIPGRLPGIPAIFTAGTGIAKSGLKQRKVHTVKHVILSFIRNESGAAAAEYALILAIVGAGIAVAAANLGTAISTAINTAQGKI